MDGNRDFSGWPTAAGVGSAMESARPSNDVRGRAVIRQQPLNTNPNRASAVPSGHASPAIIRALDGLTPELAAGVRRVARSR